MKRRKWVICYRTKDGDIERVTYNCRTRVAEAFIKTIFMCGNTVIGVVSSFE